MCDNCTTIVRVLATDFEIVRVRVREKFFVREHLYNLGMERSPVNSSFFGPVNILMAFFG